MKQPVSQKPWSSQYDLSIANMQKWRSLRPWTPQQTKTWADSRERGAQKPSSDDLFARLCRCGDRLLWTAMAALCAGLFFVAYQVFTAFASGRVQQILEAIKASH
jgi:hypothetical protein